MPATARRAAPARTPPPPVPTSTPVALGDPAPSLAVPARRPGHGAPERPGAAYPAPVPAEPLILTLALDPDAQDRFDRLRREHFPAARNHLRAHVTLFHQLPGEELGAVDAELGRTAAGRAPAEVEVTGVRFLGRGVAYALRSPAVDDLRAGLAAAWQPWLTPQDRQRPALHVTVQNKVAPERARALHAQLSAAFAPGVVQARRLDLWRYLGGPWEHLTSHPFPG